MRVKRFTAETLEDAVGLVKEEFGDDALIIETRRVRGGVLRFWRRPGYEVVAALESDARPRRTELAVQPRIETGAPDPWIRLHALLRSQGLPDVTIQGVMQTVQASLADEPGPLDWPRVRQAAAAHMLGGLSCVGADEIVGERGVLPVIGPSGVGKTSVLTKLATNFALLGGRRVAIVTADTQRFGAVEQLRAYARLIQVPFEVAETPAELKAHVEAHADKDLIFVDTPGCSPYADDELRNLQSLLAVLDRPVTYLVLSATTKWEDLFDLTRRFERVGYERIIVSKLDETRTFGAVYMLGVTAGKPLAYLTTGQDVPEDIEVAEAERVVGLLLASEEM